MANLECLRGLACSQLEVVEVARHLVASGDGSAATWSMRAVRPYKRSSIARILPRAHHLEQAVAGEHVHVVRVRALGALDRGRELGDGRGPLVKEP